MTLVPWKCGQLLVWDAICPDTFASLCRRQATNAAGVVKAAAEEMKVGKCAPLNQAYLFNPVAIETTGALGPCTAAFLKELGMRIQGFCLSATALVSSSAEGECSDGDGNL